MAHPRTSVADLLRQAGQAREFGALDKAAKLCHLVLKSHPRQTDALHLLAILALETGNFAEADRRFRAVLAIHPHSQQTLLNHSIALCELGRFEEACAQCDRALLLGGEQARGHALRASALRGLKRGADALASYDRALELSPRNGEIHFNRGNLLQDLGRFEEALSSYAAALALAPDHVGVINNLGTALRELGRYEEALQSYDRALSIDPRSWQAHNNRGNLFTLTGRLDEAISAFEQAIVLAPRDPESHYNLGNALQDLGRHAEAMQSYTKALSLKPNYVEALINRAGAARRLKLYQKALADYASVRRLNPRSPYLEGYIAHTRAQCCDWTHLEDEKALIDAIGRGERACEPFSLLSLCDDERVQQTCAQNWVEHKFARIAELPRRAARQDDRIRVAYLSPDFRNHATSHLLSRLIELHDRRQFRIVGVSFGPKANDAMRRRISGAFDAFIDVSAVSDLTAAAMLEAEGVDIAVDLAGHTEYARTGILARRPAAVQANYLGYPGTMGARFIDYLIADPRIIPEASKPLYTEKIVYLPDTYQANDDQAEVAAVPSSRPQAGLPAEGFVFCCFNNSYKIRPHVFAVWMRLLRRVAGSVLWLLGDSPACVDNLRREAKSHGVAPERLIFAPRVSSAEHLARHKLAGLFLDTLPYNAHTTASDALRAGVPLVTCVGHSFAGRVAASLLQAVGLTELVTRSLADYEELVTKLAANPDHLARVRAELAANLRTHALFDADRFRRNIEAAYREMSRRQLAGEPPADFSVGVG